MKTLTLDLVNKEIEFRTNIRPCTHVDPEFSENAISILSKMISELEAQIPFELVEERKAAPKKRVPVKRTPIDMMLDGEDEEDDENWPELSVEEDEEDEDDDE